MRDYLFRHPLIPDGSKTKSGIASVRGKVQHRSLSKYSKAEVSKIETDVDLLCGSADAQKTISWHLENCPKVCETAFRFFFEPLLKENWKAAWRRHSDLPVDMRFIMADAKRKMADAEKSLAALRKSLEKNRKLFRKKLTALQTGHKTLIRADSEELFQRNVALQIDYFSIVNLLQLLNETEKRITEFSSGQETSV